MREIKFRAWNVEEKKMYAVEAIDWSESTIVTCHLYDGKQTRKLYPNKEYGDDIEFMQYTGRKDKNEKEIYEGDILETEGKLGVVRWDEVESRFRVYFASTGHSIAYNYPISSFHNYKLVGNIYENPELVEESPKATWPYSGEMPDDTEEGCVN